MDNKDVPIPNKDTDLFKIVQGGYHIACIQDIDFETYCLGYLDACKLLLEKMEGDKLFISDTLVYPIVFLFRQYLELRFKKIIIIGSYIKNVKEDVSKYNHDLNKLWAKTKKCIKIEYPQSIENEIRIVDKNIEQIQNKIDQQATAFRYPTNKKGNKSFCKNFHIDLKQFHKSMVEISNFLDGCSEALINHLEIKNELRREHYRDNY